jgi:hypothetical protein
MSAVPAKLAATGAETAGAAVDAAAGVVAAADAAGVAERSLCNLVAYFYFEFFNDTGMAAGNLHACLVGFDRDQRLLGLDRIARLDQQFNDFNFLEVANIRNVNFHRAHVCTPLFLHGETDHTARQC